ncbi:hypothetical protein ABZX88_17285 [Kitasatospora aureofaciens]|uniref:hypothetical protein n=1 Tax=Kitasatospora aureofaciens TaxID=1894 RepID=UPI0033A43E96
MDTIELLEHDHRMVEQLFRDYPAAPALTPAGPVAVVYDRLRDRLQGRPRT